MPQPRQPLIISKILALGNSADWASTRASAAIYASVRVDLILAVALGDSADRAFAGAGTAADASIGNYICH